MLYFMPPWLFCNYQFVLLNPLTFCIHSPNSPLIWQPSKCSLYLWVCLIFAGLLILFNWKYYSEKRKEKENTILTIVTAAWPATLSLNCDWKAEPSCRCLHGAGRATRARSEETVFYNPQQYWLFSSAFCKNQKSGVAEGWPGAGRKRNFQVVQEEPERVASIERDLWVPGYLS